MMDRIFVLSFKEDSIKQIKIRKVMKQKRKANKNTKYRFYQLYWKNSVKDAGRKY